MVILMGLSPLRGRRRWSVAIPLAGGFFGARWDSKEEKHIYCPVALSVSEKEQDLRLTNRNYETASRNEEKILHRAWCYCSVRGRCSDVNGMMDEGGILMQNEIRAEILR